MNRPLVLAALSLIAGCYAAAYGVCDGPVIPAVIFLTGIAIPLIFKFKRPSDIICVSMAFFAAGAMLWTVSHLGEPGDPLARLGIAPSSQVTIEGRVRNPDIHLPHRDRLKFVLDVDHVIHDNYKIEVQGRTLVRWYSSDKSLFHGDRVTVTGSYSPSIGLVNFSISDIEDHMRRRNVHSSVSAKGQSAVTVIDPGTRWNPLTLLSRFRTYQAEKLSAILPPGIRPFVLAVWLGDRADMDHGKYREYVRSGTAHVLAVSGVHMGLVYISLAYLLRLTLKNRRRRSLLIMVCVMLFGVIAGARIASVRAAMMISIYLLSDCFDRQPDAPNALGISGMIFVLLSPDILFDTGFLLSFSSVASILVFHEPLNQLLAPLPRKLREPLAGTLSVQILALPFAVNAFHVMPVVAPVANLLVMPLLAIVLWLSMLVSITAMISTGIALLFSYCLLGPVYLIEDISHTLANIPGAFFNLTTPSPAALVLYLCAALALYTGLRRSSNRARWMAGAVALLISSALLWRAVPERAEVTFLDVGHGDSVFLRSPEGIKVLVDGGDASKFTDMGERVVGPYLYASHIKRLDCVVVSHADGDHIGGLIHIVKNFDVGMAVMSRFPADSAAGKQFLKACEARDVPVLRVKACDVISIGDLDLQILHPHDDWSQSTGRNNDSLVLKCNIKGVTFLLPGDIESEAEHALSNLNVHADVMKVPHHGSATSSTAEFINAVQPSYCVISTGKKFSGDAADADVIKRYRQSGTQILRTDHEGAFRLRWHRDKAIWESARASKGYPFYEPAP